MPQVSFDVNDPVIVSVGGSLIVPEDGPDSAFLQRFREVILHIVQQGKKVVIITGGGRTARHYIEAASKVQQISPEDLDWLGIHATRLNGQLVKTVLSDVAHPVMYKNPLKVPQMNKWQGSVLVAAGWKPGWSTDFVASRIAKRLDAKCVLNLSNIDFVYDNDPKINPHAQPQEFLRWRDYRSLVGDVWSPGLSAPFDPVAAKFCHKHGIAVAVINGKQFERVKQAISGQEFVGSLLT
jgi:uridylate kinase